MRRTAIVGGEPVEIRLHHSNGRVKATVGGREYELAVTEIGPGAYWLDWNGRSVEAVVTGKGPEYLVSIDERHIPVTFPDVTRLRQAAHSGHDGLIEVHAPMPGKIVRVLLNEGDDVDAHQGIVVMEAMKMQNEVRSPRRGRIRKIGVAAGVAVNPGDLIALVE